MVNMLGLGQDGMLIKSKLVHKSDVIGDLGLPIGIAMPITGALKGTWRAAYVLGLGSKVGMFLSRSRRLLVQILETIQKEARARFRVGIGSIRLDLMKVYFVIKG